MLTTITTTFVALLFLTVGYAFGVTSATSRARAEAFQKLPDVAMTLITQTLNGLQKAIMDEEQSAEPTPPPVDID